MIIVLELVKLFFTGLPCSFGAFVVHAHVANWENEEIDKKFLLKLLMFEVIQQDDLA